MNTMQDIQYTPEAAPTVVETDETQLILFICKAFSGEIVRAVVRSEMTVVQAIPEIADQIGYSSPDWEKIGLYNMTRDFEYDPEQSFAQTRTVSGDLVIMADGAGCHKKEDM